MRLPKGNISFNYSTKIGNFLKTNITFAVDFALSGKCRHVFMLFYESFCTCDISLAHYLPFISHMKQAKRYPARVSAEAFDAMGSALIPCYFIFK